MPFVHIPYPVHYREHGSGFPLLFLHSGWGHDSMPFDPQIPAFEPDYRILIPYRSGYGKSRHLPELPLHFHQDAAVETLAFLDALGIERAVLWGHSDGAVIAAIAAMRAPGRFPALVLEAFHRNFGKPSNQEFFQKGAADPDSFGPRVAALLEREHGEDWRLVIRNFSRAWIELGKWKDQPESFFYGAPLHTLTAPALFLKGQKDPRIEPGEFEQIQHVLPNQRFRVIEGAGHSPHSEPGLAPAVSRAVAEFLKQVNPSD
ncbi:MAG: alpha/beta hydrolase [Bryobacteraceae bacterium]|nr:alpha/beta hydrolase [Bryobacteraceae bacterium]